MTTTHDTSDSADVYSRVTRHIVDALEKHNRLPLGGLTLPVNAVTGKAYRGVNILALWVASVRSGFTPARWGTLRQWNELGGRVRKGEKATVVAFWKTYETEGAAAADGDGAGEERERRFVARGYAVFNAEQVEGSGEEPPLASVPAESIAEADEFARMLGADIRPGGEMACYQLAGDYIQMPHRDHFRDGTGYFATLAHELTHWTGAGSRLARDLTGRFGSGAYAMEELVAELGAAFLCATLGVSPEPRADHARYVASWLEVLRNDTRAVFTAAAKAQQAADWMHARARPAALAA